MKAGKNLMDLAKEITRQADNKADYVLPTTKISMVANRLSIPDVQDAPFDLTNNTHSQISAFTNIPKKYYDVMKDTSPELLSTNVNHWFSKSGSRRMVRTLDGTARAFMSDRYRILDNMEILESMLPVLSDMQVDFKSMDVTDRRMYVKGLFPKVQAEVKKGDVVQAGFSLSNSEIGMGSVNVQLLVYRLICENGAIMPDAGIRKFHIGRINQDMRIYKDETMIADDRAFMLKLRDTLASIATEDGFNKVVEVIRDKTDKKLDDPLQAIEVVQKKYTFNDGEKKSVLRHLIEGADLSQYGMFNAVTRASQDINDYDRATELEAIGGNIITLNDSEWTEIAKAA